MAQAKKELEEKKATNIAVATDFEDYAGAGQEEVNSEDVAIPFVGILQALSPQLEEGESKFIEGAKQGMIFSSVTGELFPSAEGIKVVPCYYRRTIIEWNLRENGGGIVNVFGANDALPETTKDDRGRDITANGTQLVITASFFCLLIHPNESFEPVVINMSSTQLKKAKQWNALIKGSMAQGKNGMYQLPSFANVYHLTTAKESNAKGTWYGWVIAKERMVDQTNPFEANAVEAAKQFHAMVQSGERVATYDGDEATVAGGGEQEEGEKF